MTEVHYFPRYSQPENVVTNNTLLLLLRLHEYNRFKFDKFMEAICAEQDMQICGFGLQFSQQKWTGKSVVDGFIAQDSIKIAVETKLTEKFDPVQFEKHFEVFKAEQHKLLILLSPSLGAHPGWQLALVRAHAVPRNIQVVHTSFEEIVEKARNCLSMHDEEMIALVNDYEAFCSDMNLLPRDEYTMFVPPCGQTHEIIVAQQLYFCPASWSRRKARYLGVYYNKAVRHIGTIAKVVKCEVKDGNTTSETVPLTNDERKRISRAAAAAASMDQNEWDLAKGWQFFLCDEMYETNFRKSSPGGMFGHHYFDLRRDYFSDGVPAELLEIAERLRNEEWA